MNGRTAATQKSLAIAALLLGAAAIAFAPIFVRLSDTSPAASAFWRVALAVPLLWLWVALSERGKRAGATDGTSGTSQPVHWTPLVLAGLCFAGDLGVWHIAIGYTSVANSTLEANFAPIFVTLGAWLLFRQRVSRLFLVALCVTLLGAGLLIGPNFGGNDKALLGDALGVLTAVFYAGYMLSLKSATSRSSTARIMLINTAVAAAALAPWALLTAERLVPAEASGWLVLGGLALIAQVAGQSLIAFGFAHLPASFSSVSLLLQPVLAAVYAWVLLGEGMGPLQMAGGAVVLLGIYLAKRGS
jgi:drug/metabolite transporter (DMT)-like permease